MNDFDLHYMHTVRSSELIAEAENERRARRVVNAGKAIGDGTGAGRREGVVARVAKALGRKETGAEGSSGGSHRRLQSAK